MNYLFISSFFIYSLVMSSFGIQLHVKELKDPSEKENMALLNFDGKKLKQHSNMITKSLKDEHDEKLKKWHMDCFTETGVNPDLVLMLRAGKWRVNNKLLKDWVLCVLNKYDLMSKEAVFKLDTAMSLVPKSDWVMMEDFIDECLPKKALPPREIAWRYAKCYHLSSKEPKYRKMRFHYMTLFY